MRISRNIIVVAVLLVVFSALLAATRPAVANLYTQEATPTVESVQPVAPPDSLATQPADAGPRRTGTLLVTALLLGCGMVGMLAAGIGIAVVMGRLRTHRPE